MGNSQSDSECSIEATLAVLGDRWTLLVLRDVFRGVRRFSDLQRDLGIAKNILADRLNKLVHSGVLDKVPYQERPLRHEYQLTDKGADLSPALIALMGWGDRWYSHGSPPTTLVHASCGSPLQQRVTCPACSVDLKPGQIRSQSQYHQSESQEDRSHGSQAHGSQAIVKV